MPRKKIRSNKKCLEELKRLESKSLNKNPPIWEKALQGALKIAFLNCHSLQDKFFDIKSDQILLFSDTIFLTETWLNEDHNINQLKIDGYQSHFNSFSKERGKGVAIYFKKKNFRIKQLLTTSEIHTSIHGIFR